MEEQEEDKYNVDGVQFLPGDIRGLSAKLNILLAENSAGNEKSNSQYNRLTEETKTYRIKIIQISIHFCIIVLFKSRYRHVMEDREFSTTYFKMFSGRQLHLQFLNNTNKME